MRPKVRRLKYEPRFVFDLGYFRHAVLPCSPMGQDYYFYLLRCSDNSLYAGICIDLEQRLDAHQNGKSAKYTRSRLPVTLVFHEQHQTKGDALRREAEVKRWPKQRKERLVAGSHA